MIKYANKSGWRRKMIKYANKSGYSEVWGFKIGRKYIRVLFNDCVERRYTYRSAGEENVEIMKQLALKGKGLGTFIYRHVAYRYEK